MKTITLPDVACRRLAAGLLWVVCLAAAGRHAVADPPARPPTFAELAGEIAGIDPSVPGHLAGLHGAAAGLEAAEEGRSVSDAESRSLRTDLQGKFNAWTRARVDEIDPADPASLRNFFDLQAVQATSEYEEHTDADTKAYKEQEMARKFNEWVRNRVDEIDPADPGSLKYFFWLQTVQKTDKYEEFATPETHEYKEQEMARKFNEWVTGRVDEIDPADPGSLKYFFWLQTVQKTDKYEEFATPETHEYKEREMARKFNEWVRNRVDELNSSDPDYIEDLEALRVIQLTDKYDLFATAETRQYKEEQLRDKFGQYVTNLVDALVPGSPTFMQQLSDLRLLQDGELYGEFCPPWARDTKEQQIAQKLAGPPGMPPEVVGSWPEPGTAGAECLRPLVIAFSRPMMPDSIPPAILVSPPTPFTAEGMDNGHVWEIRPQPLWQPDTAYLLVITPAAMSMEGIPLLMPYEAPFTTEPAGPPPEVVATVPANGEPEAPGSEPIEIVFNRPMWPESVEAGLSVSPPFPYEPTWPPGDTTVRLQPLAPLPSDTAFTVDIAPSAASSTGVPMADPFQLRFFTGIHGLAHVLGTLPAGGQTGIPANHPIQIAFDRPMNPASVEAALTIDPPIVKVPLWFEAGFVLRIEPAYSIEPGTTYTITITDAAVSTFGLPLDGGFQFAFTTGEPIYPRTLSAVVVQTGSGIEIRADPGDMHEYLRSFAPGETLPVVLFQAAEPGGVQPLIDAYLLGEPVPRIVATEYDAEVRAVRFTDPLAEGATRGFYKALMEY